MPRTDRTLALGFCVLFLICGLIWIGQPGFQNDELLFGSAIYDPGLFPHGISVFRRRIPLMLMPYLGTLKTLVYWPVLSLFGASPLTLRLPVLLTGVAVLWILYRTLLRWGRAAAVTGTALLATDSAFLWATRCDWGPVALQHLLWTAGMSAFISGRPMLGAFCFGLGLWDKALFLWMLAGAAIAALIFYRRSVLQPRLVAAFLLGAAPLILYNFRSRGETLRQPVQFRPALLGERSLLLRGALNHGNLIGFLVPSEQDGAPRGPRTAAERTPVGISDALGRPSERYLTELLAVCLMLLPWLRKRELLFAWTALGVAAVPILLVEGVGGSAHHQLLLWPLPHIIAALTVAALPPAIRIPAYAAVAALSVWGLAVSNEHHAQRIRFGNTRGWSDAVYTVAQETARPGATIVIADWGISNTLRTLHGGRQKLVDIAFALNENQLQPAADYIPRTECLFVAPVKGEAAFPNNRERLEQVADSLGYRREVVMTIADDAGRARFDLFRYVTR